LGKGYFGRKIKKSVKVNAFDEPNVAILVSEHKVTQFNQTKRAVIMELAVPVCLHESVSAALIGGKRRGTNKAAILA